MIIKPKWLARLKPLVQIIRDTSKEAKFVGGCVRDAILNKTVNDFDLATDARPEFLTTVLKKNGIKVIPTGLKHGTITALYQQIPVEITTLRHDIECDGRHAKIAFTDNWQEDAKRRDFTFNALYLDVEGRVFDYFFGLEDLQCKRLCFVGDIKTRIEEDYLRILRAFRFHAKICTQDLDKKILFACTQYKNKIDDISGERIYSEMKKLLSYPSAIEECIVMQSCEVLKKICNFNVIFSNISILRASEAQDPLVKLAIIVKNCDTKSSKALNWLQKRWKIAKKDYQKLNTLIEEKLNSSTKKNLLDFGKENAKDMFFILYAENQITKKELNSAIQELSLHQKPEFPLRGKDIKDLGYSGVEIGVVLSTLKKKWEDSDYNATKSDLLNIIN